MDSGSTARKLSPPASVPDTRFPGRWGSIVAFAVVAAIAFLLGWLLRGL